MFLPVVGKPSAGPLPIFRTVEVCDGHDWAVVVGIATAADGFAQEEVSDAQIHD